MRKIHTNISSVFIIAIGDVTMIGKLFNFSGCNENHAFPRGRQTLEAGLKAKTEMIRRELERNIDKEQAQLCSDKIIMLSKELDKLIFEYYVKGKEG